MLSALALNRSAFNSILFRPRIMVDVDLCDTSCIMMGAPSSLPVFISPAGMAGLAHERGERVLASSAGECGIIQMVRKYTRAIARVYPFFYPPRPVLHPLPLAISSHTPPMPTFLLTRPSTPHPLTPLPARSLRSRALTLASDINQRLGPPRRNRRIPLPPLATILHATLCRSKSTQIGNPLAHD